MVFVRATDRMRRFFSEAWDAADGGHGVWEQKAVNDLAARPEYAPTIEAIDDRWNRTLSLPGVTAEGAAVCAWHGREDEAWKHARMSQFLEARRRAEGGAGPEPHEELAAEVARIRRFEYVRIGHDRRPMELLPGGRIGAGAADCEEFWSIEPGVSGRPALLLLGRGRVTARLHSGSDGVFRGGWLVHERMPVELRPGESHSIR